ncbi:GDSL-type esterase/lipase family protein [Marinicella sp. W31]|uniref:GDSL-type esterase/lipase family protein n=1 Tax=Marinicella sp. W31 TaxID=3023713 RepID=UPI0037580EB7
MLIMRTITLCSFFLLISQLTHAQRVLIVGDSWAEQQWQDQSHNMVFTANGHPDITALGDTTAISGSTAADWIAPTELQRIADALDNNPDIDIVQLTIGGNDFLDAWRADFTPMQTLTLQQQIQTDIQTIVDFILAQDPNIEIILSFYDYPNFVDTIGGFTGIICNNLHTDLAQPTPLELNTAARDFEQAYTQIADNLSRVYHVSHAGSMQNTFGFPDDNILPGDILPPGDLNLPSPVASMRVTFTVVDCFHLGAQGYDVLIQNLYDDYFQEKFDTIFRTAFD